MKKILSILFTAVALLSACEEKLPLYSDYQAYLNFDVPSKEDTLVNYSFVFSGGLQRDTVWIRVNTMGYISSTARPFKLKQVATGRHDAEAGKHFVALDAPEMTEHLVIPANENYADVPIYVLRDASLNNEIYNLRIEVEDNGIFKPGYTEQKFIQIAITSKLNKPSQWGYYMDHYFGKWGPVKHQFMMDITKQKWDDNYIKTLFKDQNFTKYLVNKLSRALDEKNQQLKQEGKSILKEEDGTIVAFGR